MKTKSKRFLNLATLCLALLGTTLLMEQPVKAEVQVIRQEQLSDTETSENETNDPEMNEYLQEREKGYGDGYRDGSQPNAPEVSDSELDEKAKKKAQSEGYGDGYSDGYQLGYSEGWQKHHPIQAFLSFIWYVISDFFSLR
ncbi:TPA: hypothetical protein ACIEXI_001352 [Streptococcus pyogenes]|nr:hypothetical protein [Streptococcus pyogenes]